MSNFEQALAYGGGAGLAGGLGGALGGGGFWGKPERVEQFQKYTPQQQSALNQLLSSGMQNSDFGPIREREINRFQTETVPSLAERFTAMGGSGQRSSGFQNALGRAGAGLGTDLAAMQSQFGMQQLGMGLQPQFENVFRPRQPGMFESGLSSIASFLPFLSFL